MDFNELTKIEDKTKDFDQVDIEKNKVMGILSYIGILVLIPIFAAKDSPFAKYHAEQGIPLCIAEIAISVLATIFGFIPVIGFIFGLIFWLLDLGILVLAILGIVYSAQGQAKDLPIVGKLRFIKL